jgi:putative copper export protein
MMDPIAMASYYTFLSLHILGATVWAGGHLVLALTILPTALRERSATAVSEFEQRFERIGLPALAVQIVTGLWLAEHLLGSPDHWFKSDSVARVVQVKLGLLALTIALAVHARFRVIPQLSDATLPTLAWHIRAVTLAAVLFVLAGASIRVGGYPVFER